MRKKILIIGIVLLIAGFLLEFIAGAVFPGNITIPLIYGSNQALWLFIAFVGLIVGLVGLFLKSKKK